MSDHELDRRYQDQAFKLDITRQITEIKGELQVNTQETKGVKSEVKDLNKMLMGDGRFDRGMVGQTLDNRIAVDSLKSFLKVWIPIIGLVIVLFADQLSPIIRDWLYEKTKMKVFYSPVKEFKEEKVRPHIRHITIIQKVDPDGQVE